ncbi:beta-ketoacyl-ACP synthase III [Cellulosilyticum sp. I15G10I2]|uniref:beta-ketoacyl-ACP synthase III n=1 Tax=Cellulosilyticum sp. I15G10I2 TaxID=1892843 RepID=UPI00085C1807|nr:beta-ketoacyl-ACP synthase III [Cellulosilyticum sp. I15G10I2]
MYGVKISGLGKAVPELEVSNDDIAKFIDTSDEWIESRTGIKSRHISTGETTTDLAASAAQHALTDSGLNADAIDLVIVATVTPDYTMPSTACCVAQRLGIKNATCFDLAAACSGFIFASEVAVSLIHQGNYKHALVIGAEVLSKTVDWEDRNTCVLFADGAGAAVYARSNENKVIKILTASDGDGSDLITLPSLTEPNKFNETQNTQKYMQMNGREVYKFATTAVPQNIQNVLADTGYTPQDIDLFILHQANARIMDSVAKKLDVDNEKFFKNLHKYGNTSAASIPIALADAKEKLKPGDKIILSGFGAGLTWGSMFIVWE